MILQKRKRDSSGHSLPGKRVLVRPPVRMQDQEHDAPRDGLLDNLE